MENAWITIARSVYGLLEPALLESRKHFGTHYFLQTESDIYVLSRSRFQPDRMAKPYQFELITDLKFHGFDFVELPVKTLDRKFCHLEDNNWWVLQKYASSDQNVVWDSEIQIKKSAQILARFHACGRKFKEDLLTESRREDLGPYYVPSIRWAYRSREIAKHFQWDQLNRSETALVQSQLHFIQTCADDILSRSVGTISITHQDYRPVNIRVLNGDIAGLWDFDMAVIDSCLYDLAFSSLQFGGRECLFPDISLDLAQIFIQEYVTSSGLTVILKEPDLLRWFLVLAVLKRLLLNYHIPERVELLQMVCNWDWN